MRYILKNHFENRLKSPLFFFFFKRKKKTLNVTHGKKNVSLEKSDLGLRVMLLIEKVQWQTVTLL